jgi:hypothetical protein
MPRHRVAQNLPFPRSDGRALFTINFQAEPLLDLNQRPLGPEPRAAGRSEAKWIVDYLVSIWCLFLSRTRENCGDWRETIEMRRSQYSCGLQRMLPHWRELAEVGGVESLTLRHRPPFLFHYIIGGCFAEPQEAVSCREEISCATISLSSSGRAGLTR